MKAPIIPGHLDVEEIVNAYADVALRLASFRTYLGTEDGAGATVVRIEEVRKIFGWQNDKPITRPPAPANPRTRPRR